MRINLRAALHPLTAMKLSRLMFACALGVVARTVYSVRHFQLDDALIYARYVRNLHAGHGLVYNLNEAHNGITSPLYVWLLAAASAPFKDVPQVSVLLGGILLGIAVYVVTFKVFPREESPLVGAVAGLLIATTPLNYTTLGMESPLVLALASGLLVAYRLRSITGLGVLGGLLCMARSECGLLVAALFVAVWYESRRLPWKSTAIAFATMVPFFAYNTLAFGSPLPDTLAAKIYQGRSGYWGERWVFIKGAIDILGAFYIGPIKTLLLLAGSLLCLVRRPPPFPFVPIMALLSGLLAFYGAFSVPAYHWYLVPVVWGLQLLAPLGAAQAIRQATAGTPRDLRMFGAGAASAILLAAHGSMIATPPAAPMASYKQIGEWLATNASPNSSLGAAEIGHLGWYSNLRIVDLCGLVTPNTASFLGKRDVDKWLSELRPDHVLIHEPAWPLEAGAIRALARGEYERDPRLKVSGFQLLSRSKNSVNHAGESLLGRIQRHDDYVRDGLFSINGVTKAGLFEHPVTDLAYTIDSTKPHVLSASVGVAAPSNVTEACDGVSFVVLAQDSAGKRTELLRKHVSPKDGWQSIEVAIPPAAQLILRTEHGPAGEKSWDWAVWGEPRLRASVPVATGRF